MNPRRDPLLGARIENRYRVDARIARGGMSVVYMGVDLRLDRPVALKVMDPRYAADPAFVSRFEFEARAVARLKHPALVAVYDQGVDVDGLGEHIAYLAMELVSGGTLRELLHERGPMPPHAVAAVAGPVLGALGTAHRAGLVHRDIKPENVLISDEGEVKVADFGLVRAVAASGATNSGVILGTAAYLSPEQVRSATADARSDVYATGILIFELLTGRTPFTGDTALSLAYARLDHDVPPPSAVIAGVPAEFDDLVLRATARDRMQRFADAGEMADELEAICDDLGLPAFRVPAPVGSAEHAAARVRANALHPGEGAADPTVAVAPLDQSPDVRSDPVGPTVTRQVTAHPDPEMPGEPDHRLDDPGPQLRPREFATPAEIEPEYSEPGYDRLTPSPDQTAQRRAAQAATAEQEQTRGRRRAIMWTTIIVIATLLIALGGWWLGSGRFTVIPDITSLDRADAVAAIEDAGLDVDQVGTFSDDLTTDAVIAADPPSGSRVSRFSTVRLEFSRGQPVVPDIPDGASVDRVHALLNDNSLRPVDGEAQFSNSPRGAVITLSPAPGSRVAVGAEITVIASKGPAPVVIPDLRGQSEDQARLLLTRAGLRVGDTRSRFDSGVDGGQAIGTDPPRGRTVDSDSQVTLLISNAITVPDTANLTPAEAEQALRGAGLVPATGDRTESDVVDSGRVASTSPAAGTRVDPSSPQVRISVSVSVTVPPLLGQTVDTARATLEGLGLRVEVHGLLPSGSSLVIAQSPGGDSRRSVGSTVTLTVVP